MNWCWWSLSFAGRHVVVEAREEGRIGISSVLYYLCFSFIEVERGMASSDQDIDDHADYSACSCSFFSYIPLIRQDLGRENGISASERATHVLSLFYCLDENFVFLGPIVRRYDLIKRADRPRRLHSAS